ncbi:DUF2968 domain-containing protein [Paraburkholderia antibiotica]|uniref:DUF2968 domain-containing protein n=1 Tax=Paraburkholderia antibiotica TaxID=2728839 RepID=A0A7X9X100_9BURK|nr:DUF2968 domain-containing protein [Paraburkholderia antibiotica]NML29435.1 DUF2968 domain-containing protein [Paraburkholderia antibiotica]
MTYPLIIRRAVLLASTYALWHAGVAMAGQDGGTAPLAGTRPAVSELTPQPDAAGQGVAGQGGASANAADATADAQAGAMATSGTARGDVAELMQLIHDADLSELRTTYNGSYGASLFFYPSRMTYYVALFQDKHFWRVIRSDSAERAEAIYADFAQQTEKLADIEIRRTQLQAQNAYLQAIIETSQTQAQRLKADIDVARTQQAKVDDHQRQTRGEALALRAERDRAQAQLRAVQSQVMQLQQQTELGLPGQKGLPPQK